MTLPGCMAPDGAEPCEAYTTMRKMVEQMVSAIAGGSIDSQEISDQDNGIPPHKWHEEWLHHARSALANN